MPPYSPVKCSRRLWRSAAILHAMTNTAKSWTTMMMCLPPRTATSVRTGAILFRQQGDEYGVQLAESIDAEQRLLQGPTMTSTVSEEAVLLEEMPTMDMKQFLAGLETLTPTMLSEVSTRIEHLRQLVTPVASPVSMPKDSPPAPPPGLPATPTVANPMEQALLRVTSNLGTSPVRQHMPTRPPGAEETERAATLLVEQMS